MSEMIPPHLITLVFPRDQPTQRPLVIGRGNREMRGKEVEVDQSYKILKNEPFCTFQNSFQQQPSRRGFHRLRTIHSCPPNTQEAVPMEYGRQEIQTKVPLARTKRKYPDNFPQRDIHVRTRENHKKLKS
ncbi:hypothetical protein O181_093039 [Austropuccinia psidii MF-1]|uniref:Uncharacterized protein n=1 Tax=Austropuccinia psidii MF-1 TaxID=1389203 RepID=A0A9Q3P9H0_9BASI|nr:hypothetical protein [Austropuccinia psidii MF-1]